MRDDSIIHRITKLGIVVGLALAAVMLVSTVKRTADGPHYAAECAENYCPAGR